MNNYSRLVDEQAKAMGVEAVPIEEEEGGNASTDGNTIFVNPQFMSKIDNSAGEGGVRFIIAHELGHIRHGMTGGPESELDCDEFGARSIAAVGCDAKAIPAVMGELNAAPSETHPGSEERTERAMAAYRKEEATSVDIEPAKKEKRVTRFPRHAF